MGDSSVEYGGVLRDEDRASGGHCWAGVVLYFTEWDASGAGADVFGARGRPHASGLHYYGRPETGRGAAGIAGGGQPACGRGAAAGTRAEHKGTRAVGNEDSAAGNPRRHRRARAIGRRSGPHMLATDRRVRTMCRFHSGPRAAHGLVLCRSWELLYTSKSAFDIRNPLGKRVDGSKPGIEGFFGAIFGEDE